MLKFALAALLSAGTVSATYTAVVALYRASHAQLLVLEAQRDQATEQVARIQWALDDKPGAPTVGQLIEGGYISPSYTDRPRVGEPLELPAELPAEPASGAAQ